MGSGSIYLSFTSIDGDEIPELDELPALETTVSPADRTLNAQRLKQVFDYLHTRSSVVWIQVLHSARASGGRNRTKGDGTKAISTAHRPQR